MRAEGNKSATRPKKYISPAETGNQSLKLTIFHPFTVFNVALTPAPLPLLERNTREKKTTLPLNLEQAWCGHYVQTIENEDIPPKTPANIHHKSHKEHISDELATFGSVWRCFFLSHMKVSLSHFTIIYNRHLDSLNRHCIAIFLSSICECYIL